MIRKLEEPVLGFLGGGFTILVGIILVAASSPAGHLRVGGALLVPAGAVVIMLGLWVLVDNSRNPVKKEGECQPNG